MNTTREKEVTALPLLKYTVKEGAFLRDCRERVNRYFSQQQKGKLADSRMYGKTFVLFSLWIGLYLWMLSGAATGWMLLALQVAWHFSMFLMSVGIAHDGTHNAYSKRKWVNRIFSGVFDYIGINSDMWEFNHIHSHHRAPNVPVYDSAIFSLSLFRFHPKAPYHPFHRYQHRYIFVVYALSTLFKLFVLDFFSFTRKRIGFLTMQKHPVSKWAYLIFTKTVVVGYTLVIPLLVTDAPAWQVTAGFLLGHMISGIALGVIFQVTHLHRFTTWPEPDGAGNIHSSFSEHVLATTADFCAGSRLVTWVSGGLNIHVAHHLFPKISQVHLIPLARIVKETAAAHGLPYYCYDSIWQAVRSHLYTLKMLGKAEKLTLQPLAGSVQAGPI